MLEVQHRKIEAGQRQGANRGTRRELDDEGAQRRSASVLFEHVPPESGGAIEQHSRLGCLRMSLSCQ
jgi:hypothetical protein